MFFNVPPGNKDDAMMPNPLMEEENHRVHNCDDELRFSKVCEIFKVRSTESYMSKYVNLLLWGHFHAPKHDTAQNEM